MSRIPGSRRSPESIAKQRETMRARWADPVRRENWLTARKASRKPGVAWIDHVFCALRRHPEGLCLAALTEEIGAGEKRLALELVRLVAAGVVLSRFIHPRIYRLPPIAYHPRTP